MKNHIKNYIKIMGLAAVPFGTAQAEDYEIKVTQKYTCDPNDPKSEKDGAMYFRISVESSDGESLTEDIVWSVDKEYQNPIYEPGKCFRIHGADLRKEMTVINSILYPRYNEGMDAKEWVEFYMPTAGKEERVKGFARAFKCSFEIAESYERSAERYARIFASGVSKKDFFVRKLEESLCYENGSYHERGSWEEWLKRNKDDIFLCPPYDLPEDCTCVGYLLDMDHAHFRFYLLRYPLGFQLVCIAHYRSKWNLCVSSDIPTVCLGNFHRLCTDNEILTPSVRKRITDNFFVGHHKYYVKEECYSLPSEFGADFFIRQGHRADEIELNGGNAAPDRCDYFVQTDPWGEKITDIWENGKSLKLGKIKNRKFKAPKEIVKFLEEKFGKRKNQRNKKKFTIYHNSSMHVHRGFPRRLHGRHAVVLEVGNFHKISFQRSKCLKNPCHL